MNSSSLFEQALRLLGGSAVYSGSQWVMISILAHLGGPVPVGEFSLAMSITGPLAILFSLSSRMMLQIESGKRPRPFKDYWHLRLITNVLFVCAVVIVAIWRNDPNRVFNVIMITVIFKAIENLSDVTNGLAQHHNRQDLLSRSLFLRGSLGLTGFTIGYWLSRNLAIACFGIAVAWSFVFYFHDWRLTKRWHGVLTPLDFLALAKISWTALPIGIGVFVSGFNVVVPRLVLVNYAGIEALGIFSALAYTLTLGNLVVGSIANTLLTRLARHWEEAEIGSFLLVIGKASAVLAALCLAGIFAAAAFGSQILTIIYGKNFSGYGELLFVVSIGGSLSMIGTLWGYSLVVAKHFRFQLILSLLVFGSVVVLSYTLIPSLGIWGACYTIFGLGVLRCVASIGNLVYSLQFRLENVQC